MAQAAIDARPHRHPVPQRRASRSMVGIEQMTSADWDRMLDVNLRGVFLSVKACLPQMLAQRYGRIVVTSSTTGNRTLSSVSLTTRRRKAASTGSSATWRWNSPTEASP